MTSRHILIMVFLSAAVFISGCSRSNNLLLGRVETKLGTHTIIVTDCYRSRVPPAQMSKDSIDGSVVYRFAPCADAMVFIHNERLVVNGTTYERLSPGDTVIVDHGRVIINAHIARRTPETQ